MAVELECLNLIVPLDRIEAVHPGGFERYWQERGGPNAWHDGKLLRVGAMNPFDLEMAIDAFAAMGLRPTGRRAGRKVWRDVCVIQNGAEEPTLPCPWIEMDPVRGIAWLKGEAPDPVAGPGDGDWGFPP